MEFRVLGPLAVTEGGDDVPLGAAKLRTLLLRLLVDANRPVTAERLIDDLWEGNPPRSAAQTLQTYISQLRKVLGADRLASVPGGYQLVVREGEVDSTKFEEAVVEARRALAGDPARAVACLSDARSAWRGAALADAAGAAWSVTETARLDELRHVANELLIEARLALGQNGEAVATAEAAVTEHPIRERLWGLLMTALYRDGRQAEALRAFQRLRAHLADELGIDPSGELQELEARMLRQEPDLVVKPVVRSATLPTGVVSFLLTDVVGSTRLWEIATGPMADAVARHEELLRDVVQSHNGVFLKARGEGDSTFSVFQRATDAISAALDAQTRLGEEPWPTPTPLELRMAVHTGEAVERDGDYYGRTVNRAARLRTAAPPGQVMVSQATEELIVDDLPEGHRLFPLGVQELRDLERPETVFVVAPVGEAVVATGQVSTGQLPLSARLATAPAMGFVGRAGEREVLDTALKHASQGSGRVVLIAGEPGIGKSSLAAELARRAHDSGATVLFGRCDDEMGVPYRPWVEALGHLVEHAPDGLLRAMSPRQLTDLARLVPAVLDRTPGVAAPAPGDPDADRWALFSAVAAALCACADDAPLMVVLDDLQWADKPTLLLLRHIVDVVESRRVLVIGTYRDSELSADHPLTDVLVALRRGAQTERISLRGLSDDDLVELIETVTGRGLGEPELTVIHAVYRESDGNPFFATELLRHLTETGAVVLDDDGRWVPRGDVDTAGLPDSVREVVGRRVRNVGEQCEQLLNVAAVIGRDFDLPTLASAAATEEAAALEQLERAEMAGLVESVAPGAFAFSHALIANTLYRGLTPTRRANLHREVAQAIEAGPTAAGRAAELARHWAAATTAADAAKAFGYARDAGDIAMRALAPHEAVRWYGQALELLDQDPRDDDLTRCDLLVRLGRAQRNVEDPTYRATLLRAARMARELGEARLLAYAALANTRGFVGTIDREMPERLEMLEAALELNDRTSATRARLLATLASERRGRAGWSEAGPVGMWPDEVREGVYAGLGGPRPPDELAQCGRLVDEAVAIARDIGNPRLLAQVINLGFFAIWHPSTLAERLALIAEAVELAREAGDTTLLHWSLNWRMHALAESGAVDEVDDVLAEMASIATSTGQPTLQWTHRSYGSSLALLHGDIESSLALTAEAVRHTPQAETAASDVRMIEVSTLTMVAWQGGTLADEIPRYESFERRGAAAGWDAPDDPETRMRQFTLDPRFHYAHRSELALAMIEAGWMDQAVELLKAASTENFAVEYLGGYGWGCLWAEVCIRTGSRDLAHQLLDTLEPFADQVSSGGSVWFGSVAHYVGLLCDALGRSADALRYFEQAAQLNERIRAPFFLARTRLEWARVLLARQHTGDAEKAAELLASALEGARAFGCAGVVREIEALLAAPPPLPTRLSRSDTPFIGRAAELQAITASRSIALVAGEPGMGKSAIVAAVAQSAHSGGTWVLFGRCDEDVRVPYHPFVDALSQLVRHAPGSALDAVGDRQLAELSRLVPVVSDRRPGLPTPPPTDPEYERYLAMNAAVALLTEMGTRSPVVLVLDDLHWSDKQTLVLLRHLLASAPANVRVLATYRQTDLYADAPLADALPALRGERGSVHFVLEGLSTDEVAALTGADEQLAEALHRETDGNPFFTAELFRHVVETGADLSAGVPDAIRGLVRQRVARLGQSVHTTLTAASVIGQEFDLALLAVVTGDQDMALEALEVAEAAALISSEAPGQFAFAHALIQHALYDELLPTRRARLHREVANAIEASGQADARVVQLARHRSESAVTPDDIAAAVGYASRAGDQALESLAPDEAVRWYRQALELLVRLPTPDDRQRCELLLGLTEAQVRAGDPAFRSSRLAAAQLADRIGETELLVKAALTHFQRAYADDEPERRELLARALEAVAPEDSIARARLLARHSFEIMFLDPRTAMSRRREAVEMARRVGDPAALAEVLATGSYRHPDPDERQGLVEERSEALSIAEQIGDPALLFYVLPSSVGVARVVCDFAEAERRQQMLVSVAEEIRRPDLHWISLYYQGDHALLAGDVEAAERLVEQAYIVGRELQQQGADTVYAAGMQSVRWHQGRHAELQSFISDVAERTPQLVVMQLPLAHDPDRPVDLRTVVDEIPEDGSWLVTSSVLADLITRAGDTEAATKLYERMLPERELFASATPLTRGAVAHPLGTLARLLGRIDDAEEHLTAALAIHERLGAPFFIARTQLELSRLLLDRDGPGDRDHAAAMLTQARDTARHHGYAQVERRAVRLLEPA